MNGIITLREEEHQLKSAYNELKQVTEERIIGFDLKRWLKLVLEGWMLTEFEENIICVERHKRDEEERKNYRNGFYYRSLHTVYGIIAELKIPRPRLGGFTPSVFEKYERSAYFTSKLHPISVQSCTPFQALQGSNLSI
jgi:transposase-like protein